MTWLSSPAPPVFKQHDELVSGPPLPVIGRVKGLHRSLGMFILILISVSIDIFMVQVDVDSVMTSFCEEDVHAVCDWYPRCWSWYKQLSHWFALTLHHWAWWSLTNGSPLLSSLSLSCPLCLSLFSSSTLLSSNSPHPLPSQVRGRCLTEPWRGSRTAWRKSRVETGPGPGSMRSC